MRNSSCVRCPARSSSARANPALQERELIKLASIAGAVGETLRARGVSDSDADLVAQLGLATFRVAFGQWVATADAPPLSELIDATFGRVAALAQGADRGRLLSPRER